MTAAIPRSDPSLGTLGHNEAAIQGLVLKKPLLKKEEMRSSRSIEQWTSYDDSDNGPHTSKAPLKCSEITWPILPK